MNKEEFHVYMKAQIKEIIKFKKKHCKKENACDCWIKKYAVKFRKKWEKKLLKDKLAEYHSIIIEIKKFEKKIQDFFKLLAVRDNPRFDRCADYGERFVEIIIPFDEINISQLSNENINIIIKTINSYRELRNKQKIIENEVNQLTSIEKNIKNNIGILNEGY